MAGETTRSKRISQEENNEQILQGVGILLDQRLKPLESKVDEIYRTLRGSDGVNGLITRVAILEKNKKSEDQGGDGEGDADIDNRKNAVTFKWIVERFGMPLFVAILLWVLLTFFPRVFGHLGGN